MWHWVYVIQDTLWWSIVDFFVTCTDIGSWYLFYLYIYITYVRKHHFFHRNSTILVVSKFTHWCLCFLHIPTGCIFNIVTCVMSQHCHFWVLNKSMNFICLEISFIFLTIYFSNTQDVIWLICSNHLSNVPYSQDSYSTYFLSFTRNAENGKHDHEYSFITWYRNSSTRTRSGNIWPVWLICSGWGLAM